MFYLRTGDTHNMAPSIYKCQNQSSVDGTEYSKVDGVLFRSLKNNLSKGKEIFVHCKTLMDFRLFL